MLYDPARHEALTTTPWSDGAAADAIALIAEDAVARFDPDALWPTHPMDEPEDADPLCMVYFGAAGVVYALHRLSAAGTPFTPRAFEPTVAGPAGAQPAQSHARAAVGFARHAAGGASHVRMDR